MNMAAAVVATQHSDLQRAAHIANLQPVLLLPWTALEAPVRTQAWSETRSACQ